jgi:hypothetical protein
MPPSSYWPICLAASTIVIWTGFLLGQGKYENGFIAFDHDAFLRQVVVCGIGVVSFFFFMLKWIGEDDTPR